MTATGANPDRVTTMRTGEVLLSSVRAACHVFLARATDVLSVTITGSGSRRFGPPDARARQRARPLRASAGPLSRASNDTPTSVGLTSVVPSQDPRISTTKFREAALKEVDGLRARGTFTAVREAELPRGANIIGGRFVYTLKNVNTKEEFAKARFVAQGYRDQAKWFVVHNLATMRQRSTRLLASTAANMHWRLFAHDITQAYLQSRDVFSRQLYLRPRPEDRHLFDLAEGELLKIELPLYGICDAGDYWDATFTAHVEQDLGMVPLTSDPALCCKRHPDGSLAGLLGYYVDDCLLGGDRSFLELTRATLVRFQGKPRVLDEMEFVGVKVATVKGASPHVSIDQRAYVDNLKRLPADAPFKMFLSARASVAWLMHTRPDLSCGVNLAAQVTEA